MNLKTSLMTRLRFLWIAFRRFYYKQVHMVDTSPWSGSILPRTGVGKYVSVFKRGAYIDIVSHRDVPLAPRGMIRLVPYQPNHGVMVEFWEPVSGENPGSVLRWRATCQYEHFFQLMGHVSEDYNRRQDN